MMRSLYSGVSGLKTHQTRMDVIGNNIANVNTIGFKKDTMNFKDQFYQSITPASGPTNATGGNNPRLVGLGVTTSSVATIHKQGNFQATGGTFNMMVDGEGFFVVQSVNGGAEYYTRAGDFERNKLGQLVDSNGNYVMVIGSKINANGDYLPVAYTDAAEGQYSKITLPSANYFDSVKVNQSGAIVGKASQDIEYWMLTGKKVDINGAEIPLSEEEQKQVLTDPTINLDERIEEMRKTQVQDLTAEQQKLTDENADMATEKAALDAYIADPITAPKPDGIADVAAAQQRLTEIANKTQANTDRLAVIADKLATGELDFTIKAGDSVNLGYAAVASFANQEGLEKIGNNLYMKSPNSGDASIGAAGYGSRGDILPEGVEMSNVDLAEEVVNMITTQRGFQANSRIITTSDAMLEELVNLKR